MAITSIEEYLAPLTNNERAVLLHAAGVRHRVARTQSVEQDLDWYQFSPFRFAREVQVPRAQIDRAVAGLVSKGYVTLTGRSDIANAVEDVKTAVREYRQAQAVAEKEKARQAALEAPAKTERYEAELEKAARAFIAAREARVPIMEKVDGFYDLHESVGDMRDAMTDLTRWSIARRRVEEEGK